MHAAENSKRPVDRITCLAVAAVVALWLTGCGTINYGDGKAGPVPLDPIAEQIAAKADKYGFGDDVRAYWSDASRERVPDGYTIEQPYLYDGKEIDLRKIVKGEPRMIRKDAAAVVPEIVEEIDRVREQIDGNPFDVVTP